MFPAVRSAPELLAPAGSLDCKDFDKSVNINLRATGALIPMVEPLLRARSGTALFFDDPRGGNGAHEFKIVDFFLFGQRGAGNGDEVVDRHGVRLQVGQLRDHCGPVAA